MLSALLLALVALVLVNAQATAPGWAQCGGKGWSGATTCVAGYTCSVSSEHYSQCIPGSSPGGGEGADATATNPAVNPIATLKPNNLWIRAVQSPNFHKYLQSKTIDKPGPAVFGSYTTAAQFQMISGQLVQMLPDGTQLYMTVKPGDNSSKYLGAEFQTEKNTYGTFSWSGDGLNWSHQDIKRPNIGAWLACGGGAAPSVNANLGPYAYQTPAGCVDQTLNYYNGATANN